MELTWNGSALELALGADKSCAIRIGYEAGPQAVLVMSVPPPPSTPLAHSGEMLVVPEMTSTARVIKIKPSHGGTMYSAAPTTPAATPDESHLTEIPAWEMVTRRFTDGASSMDVVIVVVDETGGGGAVDVRRKTGKFLRDLGHI